MNSLYNILATNNMLTSTENLINKNRESTIYKSAKIYHGSTSVVNIFTVNSYIMIFNSDVEYVKNHLELWIGEEYIYSERCEFILQGVITYVVLDKEYEYTLEAKYILNDGIVKKIYLGNVSNTDEIKYISYNEPTDTFSKIEDIINCMYCIVDGVITKPVIIINDEWITIEYSYIYNSEIVICNNLIYSNYVPRDTTILVTNLDNPNIYTKYFIDDNDLLYIDSRFYPYIRTTRDGYLRVTTDNSISLNPELLRYTRMMLNPSFSYIIDPYSPYEWSNYDMEMSKEIIYPDDSYDEMIRKFSIIGKEYTSFYDVLRPTHNAINIHEDAFEEVRILNPDNSYSTIIKSIPQCDPERDILLYNGIQVYGYESINLVKNPNDDSWLVSDMIGTKYYYYSVGSIDIDNLVIVKFRSITNDTMMISDGPFEVEDDKYMIDINRAMQVMYDNALAFRYFELETKPFYDVFVDKDAPFVLTSDELWLNTTELANNEFFDNIKTSLVELDGLSRVIKRKWHMTDNEGVQVFDVYNEDIGEVTDPLFQNSLIFIKEDSMLVKINETIFQVEFPIRQPGESVKVILFNDILLKFDTVTDKVIYYSLLPELMKSKMINSDNVLVFRDLLQPISEFENIKLTNEKDCFNYIVNESEDLEKYSLVYSNNIIRYNIRVEDMTIEEQSLVKLNIIKLPSDISFIPGHNALFINGIYIHSSNINITTVGEILVNFIDDIEVIDIIYCDTDKDVYNILAILKSEDIRSRSRLGTNY